jgi:hypothetical protein
LSETVETQQEENETRNYERKHCSFLLKRIRFILTGKISGVQKKPIPADRYELIQVFHKIRQKTGLFTPASAKN